MFLLIFVTFLLQSLYSCSSSSGDYYKDKGSRVQGYVSNRVISINQSDRILSILDPNSADTSFFGSRSNLPSQINAFSKLKKSKRSITEYTELCYQYQERKDCFEGELNPFLATAQYLSTNQNVTCINFFLKKKQSENPSSFYIGRDNLLYASLSKQESFELSPMKPDLRAELTAACISVQAAEGCGTILTIHSMLDKEFIFRNVLPFLNPGAPVMIQNKSGLKLDFDYSACSSLARIVLNTDEVLNKEIFDSVIDLLVQSKTEPNHENKNMIVDEKHEEMIVDDKKDEEVIVDEKHEEMIAKKESVRAFLRTLQAHAQTIQQKGYTIEPAIAYLFTIVAKGSYRDKHGLDGIKLALTDLDAALTDFSKDVSSTMKTTVNSSTNEFKNTLKIKSKSSGWFSSATSFIVPLLKYGMIFYGTVSLFQKMMPILKKIRG